MIKTFKQDWLENFYHDGKHKRVPSELKRQLRHKLDILCSASTLKDLESPPGNHLHALYGERKGQYAISVNGPWRLCFRFEDGEVYDVELIQYH
jgi:proteic killer suppression protein